MVASLAAMVAVAGCGGGSPSKTSTGGVSVDTQGQAPKPSIGDGAGGVRLEKLGDFDLPLYVTQPPGDPHHLFVVE
jgi:hypothetical protein